ncbi:MAG TPA: putative baseplate assembly protein [Baekduia sp.]|nr:putative baseplate assembly protein [Baekduia sp.]
MRLPEVVLDDRRFQDLVNEARHRIGRNCPEWTDHNVSDPGITLIELFAWMTDLLVYRVNRIPDKLHVALLELLGIELDPPAAARADLRFLLASPAEEPVTIPAETEVGTPRTSAEESTVFQLEDDFEIPAARPQAYLVARSDGLRDIRMADGVARPSGPDQLPFGSPPQLDEALYLGFDESLARLVVQVDVEATPARGAGVKPEDPPLVWEVSQRAGTWEPAEVLSDATGGFNLGSGRVVLQLPPTSGSVLLRGQTRHWLRCRLAAETRSGRPGGHYTQAPAISRITAAPVGALLPGEHAARVVGEPVGYSDGTPGQCFQLRYAPVLHLADGEHLEVRVLSDAAVEVWEARESFAASGPEDRHFVLDEATGEIQLGPAIRGEDGSWSQRGAIPPKAAQLWMSSYRHGGGQAGNVAADTLVVLKSPIPGVASVTNPRAAAGGVDVETLEHARRRAALDIRSRSRAVTASDFEFLAGEASPRVARACCVAEPGHAVRVHVLPRVVLPAARPLEPEELVPSDDLLELVSEYLDERRLIGTSVHVAPAAVRGVSVRARVRTVTGVDAARVERRAADALYRYLNPLCGGARTGEGAGWEFGRALTVGELHGLLHDVPGVTSVTALALHETQLATGRRSADAVADRLELEPHQVVASARHEVHAELDG